MLSNGDEFKIILSDGQFVVAKLQTDIPDPSGDFYGTFVIVNSLDESELPAGIYAVKFQKYKSTQADIKSSDLEYRAYFLDLGAADGYLVPE